MATRIAFRNSRRKYLKRYLSKNPRPKILIFGCTPEIRDLCSALKLPVILFDVSEAMYYGMMKLMETKPYKEKLIKGKWEDASRFFHDNEFDIIFSDCTQNNLAIGAWNKNFNDIAHILKGNGLYFFASMVMHFDQKLSFKEIIARYRRNKKYFANFQNRLELYYEMLAEYCYNRDKRACLFYALRNKFKSYARKNNISQEEIKHIWIYDKDIEENAFADYVETTPPVGEVYEFLFPHFWIEDFYLDSSHPAYRFRRDIILRPKKNHAGPFK